MSYHEKDIVIGQARVVWGRHWVIGELFEGWCLPGGETTINRKRAEFVCEAMNEIMKGAA